jgi:hypothetical protein
MAYNEGRHHTIGKEALQKYAVPFLRASSLGVTGRIRKLLSAVWNFLGQSVRGQEAE